MSQPDGRLLYAFVTPPAELHTRHYVGLPESLDPGGQRTPLPQAVLLILETSDEGVFLIRYSPDGEFAGDTWHQNADDGKHQAQFEYGDDIEWRTPASSAKNADDLANALLKQHQ